MADNSVDQSTKTNRIIDSALHSRINSIIRSNAQKSNKQSATGKKTQESNEDINFSDQDRADRNHGESKQSDNKGSLFENASSTRTKQNKNNNNNSKKLKFQGTELDCYLIEVLFYPNFIFRKLEHNCKE